MYFMGLNTPEEASPTWSWMPANTDKRYYLKHANVLAAYVGVCDDATAKELIHAYGPDKVLWGTDYPMWDAVTEMEYFNKIDLTDEERSMILYENTAKLLKL